MSANSRSSLEGQWPLVTGATSGIGCAVNAGVVRFALTAELELAAFDTLFARFAPRIVARGP